MTLSQYVEFLFGVATGWLGWTPAQAWAATIPEIHVALRARMKWIQMQNGGEPESPAEKIARQLRSRT
jgi:hypothetical protein